MYNNKFFKAAIEGSLSGLRRALDEKESKIGKQIYSRAKEAPSKSKGKSKKKKKKKKKSKSRRRRESSESDCYDNDTERNSVVDDGFDVNVKDKEGYTALHHASRWGHFKIVEELVLYENADVNVLNYLNQTPLYLSVLYSHNRIIEFLLHHGADSGIEDCDGVSARKLMDDMEKELNNQRARINDFSDDLDDTLDEPLKEPYYTKKEMERRRQREFNEKMFFASAEDNADCSFYHDFEDQSFSPKGAPPDESEDAWVDRMRNEYFTKRRKKRKEQSQKENKRYRHHSDSDNENEGKQQKEKRAYGPERPPIAFQDELMNEISKAKRFLNLKENYDKKWATWEDLIEHLSQKKTKPDQDNTNAITNTTTTNNITASTVTTMEPPTATSTTTTAFAPPPSPPPLTSPKIEIIYSTIPWPCEEHHTFLSNILLAGVNLKDPAEIKQRLRVEVIRWHPDKFLKPIVLDNIPNDEEKEKIKNHVNEIAKEISRLKTEYKV